MDRGSRGCYGLTLTGLDGAAKSLPAAPADALTVHVTHLVGTPDPDIEEVLTADHAHLRLADHQSVATVDRTAARIVLTVVREYPDEQLLHPFISGSAAVTNRWLERNSFHAGAFVNAGRAWIVLGDKGLGKSTLLAAMDLAGLPTVSDDLVVVDGTTVYSGPGFIDLRPDAADRLGIGTSIGVVGARERSRYYLTPPAFCYPLGGWITLRWGESVDVASVGLRDRLLHLHQNSAVRRAPVDPAGFVQLVAHPFLMLTRPRDWRSLADAVAKLRQATA